MAEYVTLEYIENRVKDSFLKNNPIVVFGIIVVYLLFIKCVGPWFMRDRPAYNLKRVLIFYNLLQVVWCAKLLATNTVEILSVEYTCKKPVLIVNYEGLFQCGYQYFYMKIFDLLDTVFFVLRKKENQVTHLHVYHHVGMVIASYYVIHFIPATRMTFMVAANIFVHLLMYGYYLLTAYMTDHRKIIWWKKHITQLQLVQFLLILLVYGQMFFRENCEFPAHLYFLIFTQDIYMLYLFGQFYYKNYIKRKPANTDCRLERDTR